MKYSEISLSDLTQDEKDRIVHTVLFCADDRSATGLRWQGCPVIWDCLATPRRRIEDHERLKNELKAQIDKLTKELAALE